jgi:hypothetical protein
LSVLKVVLVINNEIYFTIAFVPGCFLIVHCRYRVSRGLAFIIRDLKGTLASPNSVVFVHKRTIPTERPSCVGEVSASSMLKI